MTEPKKSVVVEREVNVEFWTATGVRYVLTRTSRDPSVVTMVEEGGARTIEIPIKAFRAMLEAAQIVRDPV